MHVQINCAVDSPEAARVAVEGGADWLTFTPPATRRRDAHVALAEWLDSVGDALAFARKRRVRTAVALAVRLDEERLDCYRTFLATVARAGVDAIVASDLALLEHARAHAPGLDLHLAPQASVANPQALAFYARHCGIRRACLANSLDVETAAKIARSGHAEVEVFGYGAAGAMVEGLCSLSAFFAGASATREGACSPSSVASLDRTSRYRSSMLNGILVDSAPADAVLSHPAICTGRYRVGAHSTHLFGGRNGARTLEALPRLMLAGVRAVRIAPCGGAVGSAERIVRAWREAIAACRHDPEGFAVRQEWRRALAVSQTALPCTVSVSAHE